MPIDFPNNPSSGQTYSYAGQQWEYNGVAWDKLIIADDALKLVGVSGEQYLGELQTGILYGGVLSINAGNTSTFDYTAGAGFIANSGATLTALPTPTGQRISWSGATGVTLAYLSTSDTTWLRIDDTGTLLQSPSAFTNGEYQESIVLGALIHPSRSFISLAKTFPITSYGSGEQYEIFIRSFGGLKLSGHVIEASATPMRLSRTSGRAFALGRNYTNDPNYPSVVTDGNYTDAGIFRYYRGATAGTFITVPNQTVVDPANYDDGSGTLQTVSGGQYTIQRIFYFPGQTNLLGIYYGRQTYNSMDVAKANLFLEEFSEIENTLYQAIFCAYLIVKGNATDLTNTAEAEFIQGGLFRNTSSGGGGLATTSLDDLSDVTITSTANDQVLAYESGQWVNRALSTLPVVSSFNGLTGAVTGVSSVRGLTGSVGITNGSGIGLSVSGQTMTFSNTGVLSIDGGTGAITNVARTNVDNLFSASQTISAANAVLAIVDSSSFNEVSFQGEFNRLYFFNDLTSAEVYLQPTFLTASTVTVSLPNFTTTLAGLAGTQTFTGTKTFNALTNFPGGISAAGATFGGNVRLQNGEFLQNTTNGRTDIMPAPAGATHYGLYIDHTWNNLGFGTILGTVRSSDGALNTAAILFSSPLSIGNNTRFNLASDSSHSFLVTSTGNDTLQLGIRTNSSSYSGAFALIDDASLGAANRSPGVTHSNPNFYIYTNGSARANDFMRFEHDGTNGRIISGGTSGIQMVPGSGIVGVSGDIQVTTNGIYVTNNARSWFL